MLLAFSDGFGAHLPQKFFKHNAFNLWRYQPIMLTFMNCLNSVGAHSYGTDLRLVIKYNSTLFRAV